MADLADHYPKAALAITLDVTNAEQRAAAVQQTEARFGGIDVLINNAAVDFLGAIEEQDERDYRAQFEVNFFGAVGLLRLVLPGMRRRKRGTIVNVSSMVRGQSRSKRSSRIASRVATCCGTSSDPAAWERCIVRSTRRLVGSSRSSSCDRRRWGPRRTPSRRCSSVSITPYRA